MSVSSSPNGCHKAKRTNKTKLLIYCKNLITLHIRVGKTSDPKWRSLPAIS
jgi:hypothetical protein